MRFIASLFATCLLATSVQAEGDIGKGERIFKKCAACHSIEEGKARLGPSLYGVYGREAGSVEGFKYSKAMAKAGFVWDAEHLSDFLENPKKYLKGTKMSFAGLKKEDQRIDLIAYLETLQ